jgi:hypothetical protein
VSPAILEAGSQPKIGRFGRTAYDVAFGDIAQDPRITILEGAVRSGKTWALNTKILALCKYQVGGMRLLTGVSKETIYTNVLNDLFDVIGTDAYRYNRVTGDLDLFGMCGGRNHQAARELFRDAHESAVAPGCPLLRLDEPR